MDLLQEPLDRDPHQAGSAKTGHVGKDVCGIQPLVIDVQFQLLDQFGGDLIHDFGGQLVVNEVAAISLESPQAHLVSARFEIECILDIGTKEVRLDGLVIGPVVGLLKEEETGDGIEFLGGAAECGMEVLAELLGGHEVQQNGTEDTLPAVSDLFEPQGRDEPLERIEEAGLSGIDLMTHGCHNPLNSMEL